MSAPRITDRRLRPSLLVGTAPAWITEGICATRNDPDFWFSETGGNNLPAKRVCQACPVRAQCLEYGLDEKWGVWGGLGPAARKALGYGRGRRGIDWDIPEDDK